MSSDQEIYPAAFRVRGQPRQLPSRPDADALGRCLRFFGVERIVRVTYFRTAGERCPVISIQGKVLAQPLRQIRVGHKVATECHEVRIARIDDFLCRAAGDPPAAMMMPG